jgi:maltose O-acetyltransferase
MSEQRDRMISSQPYLANDPELIADYARCQQQLEKFNALPFADAHGRSVLLKQMLAEIGEDAAIRAPLQIEYGSLLWVGARTFINNDALIIDCAPVRIGSDVQIGPRVQLLTPTHPLDPAVRKTGWEAAEPITIEDGVWLGGGVIVLPGVTIGENTVVGAGSVVSRDLPPNVVAVGNPARVLRPVPTGGRTEGIPEPW